MNQANLPPLKKREPLNQQLNRIQEAQKIKAPAINTEPHGKVKIERAEYLWFSNRRSRKEHIEVHLREGTVFTGLVEWQDQTFFKLDRGPGERKVVIRKAAVEYMMKLEPVPAEPSLG